jgi:hypothetical protein
LGDIHPIVIKAGKLSQTVPKALIFSMVKHSKSSLLVILKYHIIVINYRHPSGNRTPEPLLSSYEFASVDPLLLSPFHSTILTLITTILLPAFFDTDK